MNTLARRGGLAPCELVAVLLDRPWRRMLLEDAVMVLRLVCSAFETGAAHLEARIKDLEEANERADKLLAADLSLLRMGPSELGFTLEASGRAVAIIAGHLAAWFREHHAENYTETAFEQVEISSDRQRYILTVQRGDGKSPHQLRQEAVAERDAAQARIARLEMIIAAHGRAANIRRGWRDALMVTADRLDFIASSETPSAVQPLAKVAADDIRVALSLGQGGEASGVKIIPYTDEEGEPDPDMVGLVMLAIGKDGEVPEHVHDRIPQAAASVLCGLLPSNPAGGEA
ncbi:hypothetical protein [Azospirillum tabaci]|uniref:hypothetical protein n=1 Tax=Azospirillum tabaci TaxID=2752310 RepID=UPI001660BBD5|nr:hypothetical protein [Azospirillum tabaci]